MGKIRSNLFLSLMILIGLSVITIALTLAFAGVL